MNRDRLLSDAKARALQRVREGYQPPVPRKAILVGGETVSAPLKLGVHLAHRAGRISDHDALIGRKLATIMAGGSLPHATVVSEQHLLDLEREAFSEPGRGAEDAGADRAHAEDREAAEELMRIVDVGKGAPVILVPGIQGRWEWMRPAVDALAARCRVVTFSLADEPTCGGRFDAANGFDCYVDQIREAMDLAGISTAVLAGVSYGRPHCRGVCGPAS